MHPITTFEVGNEVNEECSGAPKAWPVVKLAGQLIRFASAPLSDVPTTRRRGQGLTGHRIFHAPCTLTPQLSAILRTLANAFRNSRPHASVTFREMRSMVSVPATSGGRCQARWIGRGSVALAVLALGGLVAIVASWLEVEPMTPHFQDPKRTAAVARFAPAQKPSMPTPQFSAEAFARDRQAYLSDVVPGRAFQVLSPRPGLGTLQPASPLSPVVKPLGSVDLAVKAPPNAPVTFTSVGLGAFPNRRTSITVAAGSDGVARTQFTATRGTVGTAMVFTASPLASGQVRFYVEIQSVKNVSGRPSDAQDAQEGVR